MYGSAVPERTNYGSATLLGNRINYCLPSYNLAYYYTVTSVGDLCYFGSEPDPDLLLWLMDPDPTPDPTPFFSDFKDAKNFFLHIFSYNLPTGTLSSVLKFYFFAKSLCQNFILQALFPSAQNTFMRNGKDPEPDPDPYLRLMAPDLDSGGPKMCGSSTLRVTLPGTAIGNLLEPEKSLDGQERRLTGRDQPDPAPLTLNTIINSRQRAVLRIGTVRIRIRGSTTLTNGSGCGSGSCYFRQWPSRCQQKFFLLSSVAGSYLLFRIAINKSSAWLFYRLLASHAGGPGSIPGRDMSALGPLDYDRDNSSQVSLKYI